MARELRFTTLAARDIEEASRWYEAQRAGLGTEFEGALGATLVLLQQAPEAGPVVHRDLRRLLLPRFPYALYYRLTEARIEVRGCFHQHRDPAAWQRRT